MGLDQASLAKRAGVSRKWLVEVEQGKPRAAVGLIFYTLRALGVSLEVKDDAKRRLNRNGLPVVDINEHLERLRKRS